MKTKLFLIVIAMFATSMIFAQSESQVSSSSCEKKVAKKIKRSMSLIDVKDYVDEGKKIYVVLSYTIDENKMVKVLKSEGYDQALNNAVSQNLSDNPIKCESAQIGQEFTLLLTFKHIPWEL